METGTLELPVPEKEGQTFEGWYLTADYSGVPVERIECTCSDVKVYARWSDATYTVLYELDGGTMYEKNPESVTAETEYTLADPVREGYRFLGWYDLQNGDRYETIGGEHAKNLILCALWQKTDVHFSVRYECDGEVLGENPVSVGAGEVYKLYGAKKTGHDFGRLEHAGGRRRRISGISLRRGGIAVSVRDFSAEGISHPLRIRGDV